MIPHLDLVEVDVGDRLEVEVKVVLLGDLRYLMW
jgi:hypothetical protein